MKLVSGSEYRYKIAFRIINDSATAFTKSTVKQYLDEHGFAGNDDNCFMATGYFIGLNTGNSGFIIGIGSRNGSCSILKYTTNDISTNTQYINTDSANFNDTIIAL